jgi:hypothetical protein
MAPVFGHPDLPRPRRLQGQKTGSWGVCRIFPLSVQYPLMAQDGESISKHNHDCRILLLADRKAESMIKSIFIGVPLIVFLLVGCAETQYRESKIRVQHRDWE